MTKKESFRDSPEIAWTVRLDGKWETIEKADCWDHDWNNDFSRLESGRMKCLIHNYDRPSSVKYRITNSN